MIYDYRHIAIGELTRFAEEHKEMTLGEILYSALRNKLTGLDQKDTKEGDVSIKDLKNLMRVSDKKLYDCINTARKDERQ